MSSPIGGFMPIPLAMMMPFMAAQSMLMGDAFGKGFQFGKRKISAMSNEEFNSYTMSQMVTDMQIEFKAVIPTIKESIHDSKDVQNVIISEMIKIVPEFIKFMTEATILKPAAGAADELVHLVGTHIGHDTPGPTGDQGGTTNTITIVLKSTMHNITTRIWSDSSVTTSGTPMEPNASIRYTWAGGSNTTRHLHRSQHEGVIRAIWKYGKSKNDNNLMLMAIAYKTAWEVKYQAFLTPALI